MMAQNFNNIDDITYECFSSISDSNANWFLQEKWSGVEKKENENHSVNSPIQLEDLRGI